MSWALGSGSVTSHVYMYVCRLVCTCYLAAVGVGSLFVPYGF